MERKQGIQITEETGLMALYGGLFLGGGGGGSLVEGKRILEMTLEEGGLQILPVHGLAEDAEVITASLVGSPSSETIYVGKEHYMEVYRVFCDNWKRKPDAIITNEMGAQAITNGWLLAAMSGLPFVDAPCNGRAHPTGAMGSMGLSALADYVSLQACAGGRGERETHMFVQGSLNQASRLVRAAAESAGGFVTVLRNPVSAGYVKENAAVGALAQAIAWGRIFFEHLGSAAAIVKELEAQCGAEVLMEGRITEKQLYTQGGFDLGKIVTKDGARGIELCIWNEYMAADCEGRRLATFPDLLVLLDMETGLPFTSAEAVEGAEVCLLAVPRERLCLGSGMRDQALFREAERVLGIPLCSYVFD